MDKRHAAELTVKNMLIDPYAPLHLYSWNLPTKSLKLPAWTIPQAMTNMTAFFAVGPILVPKDVTAVYNDKDPLSPDSWLTRQDTITGAGAPADGIKLPIAGGKGMWNWLQPYAVEQTDGSVATKYNALSVGQEDEHLRLGPAPYTFVEGYPQLARPLLQPDIGGRQASGPAVASGGE